ncbi:ATP-binding protein [Perlabentimonas gracilis]|uniref:ATP-binding protein n=1 Tax=Perlabentimonas gracilis TaxID=2715279 RepID=UPI001409A024|nr:AAA family ATPase [Perlabentimonas gracilis]NHB68939.1 ATP-binding protein [Perlabentimonas gracilis]
MENLYEQSQQFIYKQESKKYRSLYSQIDWSNRLIEVNGARGVGKTTLLLQRAKEVLSGNSREVLYASLDDPYFYSNSIVDTAEMFVKYGGSFLFLDEVHKYPPKQRDYDWSAELKVIYDRYPELQIVYSGSSLLQLYKGSGDLSRRKCNYNLPGLSFREFVNWYHDQTFEVFSLASILNSHEGIAKDIVAQVKILPLFQNYLRFGYYPYYHEAPNHFYKRLKDTITVVLEQDIPAVASFSTESSIKLKKLLAALSITVPYTPNLSNLRSELFIADQRTLLKYLNALEIAELIATLDREVKGIKTLQKPEKIYLNNTNLAHCLVQGMPNIGTIRETFFLNQLRSLHKVSYTKSGDFLVNSSLSFEVGGKSKTSQQVKHIEGASLALDDIEIGFGNRIPLWLFGFLY